MKIAGALVVALIPLAWLIYVAWHIGGWGGIVVLVVLILVIRLLM